MNYKKNLDTRSRVIKKLKLLGTALFELQDALNEEKERLTSHYIKHLKQANNELLQPFLSTFAKDTSSNDFMVVDQFIQQTNIIVSQLVGKSKRSKNHRLTIYNLGV
ncbi:hypothetical protein OQJ26_10985 [Legionella sp. PATHC038]|uniref:hypothetical protein n=1 Tax=Legionella sheltonii TaxID=2992041 RepID=UPI0022435123|nr:hypothetical protein [Legionella sp. PATHC038]MCW8399314.1 hypothetical protein [Legionella sp. PATHC038]